jgi:hypothetical protein
MLNNEKTTVRLGGLIQINNRSNVLSAKRLRESARVLRNQIERTVASPATGNNQCAPLV